MDMNCEQCKAAVFQISSVLFHFFAHSLFDFTFRTKLVKLTHAQVGVGMSFSAIVFKPTVFQQTYYHGKYFSLSDKESQVQLCISCTELFNPCNRNVTVAFSVFLELSNKA